MDNMCDLADKIEGIAKKTKDGEVILLLTKLIDDRFNSISKGQASIEVKIENINGKIDSVAEADKKIKELNKDIEDMRTIRFFCQYPKIGISLLIFLILGVVMAYFSGIDNLIQLILK
jgi:hypothetical protein